MTFEMIYVPAYPKPTANKLPILTIKFSRMLG